MLKLQAVSIYPSSICQDLLRSYQISTKTVSETYDIADSILNEIKEGGYQILVLGRHSYSTTERILMGSVTSKIITHGAGIAVCVIE